MSAVPPVVAVAVLEVVFMLPAAVLGTSQLKSV